MFVDTLALFKKREAKKVTFLFFQSVCKRVPALRKSEKVSV